MLDMLIKIEETTDYVSKNSRYVKINYTKLDKIILGIDISIENHWLNSNPFNILDMQYKDIFNFLIVYHTIGNFCFWGNPKWKIDTELGELDGSYAMMYIIINKLKNNENFDLTFEEFSKILSANVEIPLLKERYDSLITMNQFLKNNNQDFYSVVKDLNEDRSLFEYIITSFPYFKDESFYNNEKIYFYKRAQLLTSDILHIKEKLEKVKVDYSHLVGCADYKIPQVMRCYGILEFNEELSQLVDNEIILEEGSPMEIEIRANTLFVINYICKKLDNKITRININDYIWLLGQDKSKMSKPYHRTLTHKY